MQQVKLTISPETERELMQVVHNNWHSGAGEIIDFNAFLDELKQFIARVEQRARDEGRYEGKNEYYFDSPEHLSDEAHRIACTLQQRWNQGNYNNSMKSFREEQSDLCNKLVSVTKKIKNAKPPTTNERKK